MIENNIEVYCDDDLRRSAFGQSYVLTCPLFLAALGREAAFGDMVKPFVLQNIVDSNDCGNVLADGTAPNEVIASIPQEYRQNLLDGMAGVAAGLKMATTQARQFMMTIPTMRQLALILSLCRSRIRQTTALNSQASPQATTAGSSIRYFHKIKLKAPEILSGAFGYTSSNSHFWYGLGIWSDITVLRYSVNLLYIIESIISCIEFKVNTADFVFNLVTIWKLR